MDNMWPDEMLLLLRKAHEGKDVYLHIKLSDGVWDYTIYDKASCRELVGWQFEADSLPDALRQIVKIHSLTIGQTGLSSLPTDLLDNIQEAANAMHCDSMVEVTLSKSDWQTILDGIEMAIDDRYEMAAHTSDPEDIDCNNSCAETLSDLHAKISEYVRRT